FAAENTFEGAEEAPETAATSVILMDAGSGAVLYEKDAHKKRDPASVTKILNLLVCLDVLDFDGEVTVDIDPEREGSRMSLQKGETITIRDLAYAMMLWSANDAAEYLGYLAGGGDMDAFCDMMDAKAVELGAKDTDYENPNGLNPEKVNNITTAYDIAVVVRAAMKDERFREIVGTQEYVIEETNKSEKREMVNTNRCLWSDLIRDAADGQKEALDKYTEEYKSNPYIYISDDENEVREAARRDAEESAKLMYKPCIGVKTGYTSTAGDCFAGYAEENGMEIIAVVLNEPRDKSKFRAAKKLWEYAFENFQTYTAAKANETQCTVRVKRGALRDVDLGVAGDVKVTELKDADPAQTVTTEVRLKEEKPMAPIEAGTVMGELIAYDNGKEVNRQDLIALETVEEGGPLSYIGIADEDAPMFLMMVGAALLVLIIIIRVIIILRRRKRADVETAAADEAAIEDEDGDSGEH
ncbi:MAG: D-alanyl-D-alanine carboxypeptidase family protein, partial [Bacillota bacterium]